ncbi:MAG: TonB-dependent receptor [Sphingomonas sp.]
MHKYRESVSAAALVAAFLCAAPAFAGAEPVPANASQDAGLAAEDQSSQEVLPQEPSGAEAQGGEIVVTGSRIQLSGMTSPTPVTMLGGEDFEKLAPSGIADALDKMPAFLNSPSTSGDATSAASDGGGSNLNLRGLGAQRTLTLLNGHRVVPNNREGAVNIDILPELLVKRVDIVTGGASAAYGTDAVAGVVNFILDTGLTGLKGNAQGGITSRGDTRSYKAQLAYGRDVGDRGHIVVSADLSHTGSAGTFGERDWYQGYSLINNPAYVANNATGRPIYITASHVVGTNFTCEGMILAATPSAAGVAAGITGLTFSSNGAQATPFIYTPVSVVGGNNAQSLTGAGGGSGCDQHLRYPLNAPQDKMHGFVYLDYEVADGVTFYVQSLISNDQSRLQPGSTNMAPPYAATIRVGNPFIPKEVSDRITAYNAAHPTARITTFSLTRDNADIYPAETNQTIVRNRTFLVTGGLDATLRTGGWFNGWKVSAYTQYSQNRQRAALYGKQRIGALYLALDVVTDPVTGNPVCYAATIDPAKYGTCVPLNLFGTGLASRAAIDYVTTPLEGDPHAVMFHYNNKQIDAEASASGQIFDGWGAGAITAAFGASYRRQEIGAYQTGASVDFGPTPTNGEPGVRGIPASLSGDPDQQFVDSFSDIAGVISVKEVFGEINVPILSDRPFFRELTLNLAARYADYSGSGGILAYKGGLEWQFVPDIKFRGTYSRDVRAASLSERFDTARTSGTVTNDPVIGKPASGTTYAFTQTTGGNPNVKPERADTFTLGLVLQPQFARGFAVSIDYYNVSINDAIAQLGVPQIIRQCASGAQELCGLITRDPTSGNVTNLHNVFINIANETASGLDLEVNYNSRISLLGGDESISVRGLSSFLFERTLKVLGSPDIRLDGQLSTITAGDEFSYSKLQLVGNIEYKNGPFAITFQERFIKGGTISNAYVEGIDVDYNHVPGVWYSDLGISYSPHEDVEIFGYITNLLDTDPPLAPGPWGAMSGSVQTNRQLYDVLGQRFTAGVRFDF